MTNPHTLAKVEANVVTFLLVILCVPLLVGIYFMMFRVWPMRYPPHVCIESFLLFNYTSSNHRINATWDVHFRVHNEDTWHVPLTALNDVVSTVLYKDVYLAQVEIPPFVMGKGNDSVVQVTLKTVDYYVDDWVVDGIDAEMSNGAVKVNFEVSASWNRGLFRGKEKVECNGVRVSGETGEMLGGRSMCCDIIYY